MTFDGTFSAANLGRGNTEPLHLSSHPGFTHTRAM
jgi:hypothetical protein